MSLWICYLACWLIISSIFVCFFKHQSFLETEWIWPWVMSLAWSVVYFVITHAFYHQDIYPLCSFIWCVRSLWIPTLVSLFPKLIFRWPTLSFPWMSGISKSTYYNRYKWQSTESTEGKYMKHTLARCCTVKTDTLADGHLLELKNKHTGGTIYS